MNKQKNIRQLRDRAEQVQRVAGIVYGVVAGKDREKAKVAKRLAKDADAVVNTAKRLIAVQGVLETADAWNIDIPRKDVYERVVSLEVRLERLIADWVMEPILTAEYRAKTKALTKQAKEIARHKAEHDVLWERDQEAVTVDLSDEEPVQYEQIHTPTAFEMHSPNPALGECGYCMRAVGGLLGARFQRWDGRHPVCIPCYFSTPESLADRSPEARVKAIIDSGHCWHCNKDIDEAFATHDGFIDEEYDAVSVGQRRFCSDCAANPAVMPTADLEIVVNQVLDRWDTLASMKVSK